jgi:uncharacterized membrane protein (GlpM family)
LRAGRKALRITTRGHSCISHDLQLYTTWPVECSRVHVPLDLWNVPTYTCYLACGMFVLARPTRPVECSRLHVLLGLWNIPAYMCHLACGMFPLTRATWPVECSRLHVPLGLWNVPAYTCHFACGMFPLTLANWPVECSRLHLPLGLWNVPAYTCHFACGMFPLASALAGHSTVTSPATCNFGYFQCITFYKIESSLVNKLFCSLKVKFSSNN